MVNNSTRGGAMRERMPTVAKWIDELREAFGHNTIDQAIREGLRDDTFGASENGHVVGSHARHRDPA